MTWKELAEAINEWPEDKQNETVMVVGEDVPMSFPYLSEASDDMYTLPDDEYIYPKIKLPQADLHAYELIIKMGTPILWCE